ncbi:MAG: class I SAM-dependent rRNA methyltransferase [Deltaproteobacteria bacterium]|nr:class I SAM-dependent rRNA methyltransferase [Deltaproteobacteria bacterium]
MSCSGAEASAVLVRPLARALRRGHPWIWRDALRGLEAEPGTVVSVVDRQGRFVARGLAEVGPIGVRVLTMDRRESVDAALFARRLSAASSLRERVVPPQTSAYRLLHGEGDRVPGAQCDIYGPYAVLRLDGSAALAWRDIIAGALAPVLAPRGVQALLARSGRQEDKKIEALWGQPPPEAVVVEEHGMLLLADLCHGQKTGLFLDQRESRRRVRELARGRRVLDLFGYTGGFSVAAGLGGAALVDTVDVAAAALELGARSWARGGLPPERLHRHARDAFAFLEQAGAQGARWDLVVADPPSFAPSEASVPAALRSYTRLHELCWRVLAPEGLYLAASCSSHVRRDAFVETLLAAAAATRRQVQLLDAWGAPADHPRLLGFPEGDYLKVLLLRALG